MKKNKVEYYTYYGMPSFGFTKENNKTKFSNVYIVESTGLNIGETKK
tara:strand:+ start:503 stop:643 length:141 start_codon:yes stop_codon:yes gene_type:complete